MKRNEINLINNFLSTVKKVSRADINYIHEPFLNHKEKSILNDCIKKNQVSAVGNYKNKFEKLIKKFTKSKYVISTSTGTSALHLALRAIGANKDHEILIPSFNFIAAANAVLYCNSTPHFVDINSKNLGIDPDYLNSYLNKISKVKNNKCINKKTNKIIYAVIPVYVFGNSYDIEKLMKVCRKFKLKMIEDSAEALGTFYKGRHAGTYGLAGCLSFNGNKIITSGSGGAVITNNKKIYEFISKLVFNGKIKHNYELIYENQSLNFRLSDLNAALGCAQMEKISFFLKLKRQLAKKYMKLFEKNNSFYFLTENSNTKSNYWLNTVILDDKHINLRSKIFQKAKLKKVPIRPVWKPLHSLNYLKKYPKSKLKITNKMYKKVINLPSSAILGK